MNNVGNTTFFTNQRGDPNSETGQEKKKKKNIIPRKKTTTQKN